MQSILIKSLPDRSRAKPGPSRATLASQFTRWLTVTWHLLLVWQRRASQRRALARLDDHRLDDLGLSREQVAHEIAKPFWLG